MQRDITNITRDLDDKSNNDIIRKKALLLDLFKSDPDLIEVLGELDPKPLNKYKDKDNPTEEELAERQEILMYNDSIKHERIIPYLKLNDTQKEVLNFIMFDIDDDDVGYYNDTIKNQYITVMCLVHNRDMETEYGIVRTDLLSYIVKDLLSWTSSLGFHVVPVEDRPMIIDAYYYCRRLKFKIKAPNIVKSHGGRNNKYDDLRRP